MIQQDQYRSHNHSLNDPGHDHESSTTWDRNLFDPKNKGWWGVDDNWRWDKTTWSYTGITISANGGVETRSKNISIKVFVRTL